LSSEPENSTTPDASSSNSLAPNPPDVPPRKRWQFSTRLIFLAMAALGVWLAVLVNSRAIPPLQRRIESLRPLDRELRVKDESQITIVSLEETWYEDNGWQIYLPSAGYQLCLATQQIDFNNTPPAGKTALLPAGLFRLELMQEKQAGGWRVMVTKDGEELLTIDEPLTWKTDRGAIGGSKFWTPRQFKPSENVVLYRRPFSLSRQVAPGTKIGRTPPPRAGLMLWIEPVAPPK
jgi:hypothetical protein